MPRADVHAQVVVDDHAVGVVDGDHRAVGVLAGEDRGLLAEQLVADDGPDAVGAHDQVRLGRGAVGEGERDGVASVLDRLQLVPQVHHALGEDAHEGVDEVAAVDQVGVGLLAGGGPRLLHDGVAGGGEDLEVVAGGGHFGDRVEDAPLAEAVHGGGAQADAGADLADPARLLVDVDAGAEEAEGLGRGGAAVTGADDGDLEVLEVRELHRWSLYF
ncbi:hypothetical protein RKD47_006151 [Streptomyces albogriseolus]